MKNILFICSRNKLRSPTAEAVFAEYEKFNVRSAGLNHDAEVSLTPEMVEWADCIFVMVRLDSILKESLNSWLQLRGQDVKESSPDSLNNKTV